MTSLSGHYDYPPAEAPLPYMSRGKKTLITGIVAVIHAVLAVMPLVFCYFSDMMEPKMTVIHVPLVDHAPNEEPAPGEPSPHPSKLRPKSIGTPDYGLPPPLPELPDLPAEEPEPQVEPEVQPQVEPQPQPQAEPKKVEPVRKVPQKREIKVSTKRVTKVVESTKKTTPKKTAEVKVSTNKVTVKKQSMQRRTVRVPNPANNAAAQNEARRRAEIAGMIKSLTGTPGGRGSAGGGAGGSNPNATGQGGGVVDREIMTYYDKVGMFLKSRWKRPHKDSLNGRTPSVDILLSIDAQGRVVMANIRRLSGIAAMDESVRELLEVCKVLPVPPKPMMFTVTMEIDP